MLDFCEKYKNDFNERLRNELRNDVVLGLTITQFLFPNDWLILGDDNVRKLPDLWKIDFSIGFEFVQCEQLCDYLQKDIFNALRKCNHDYNKTIKYLKEQNFPVNEFIFTCYKNKIISFTHNEIGHSFDILKPIYEENIRKKLNKLKNGNYSGCGKVNLVISQIERQRDFSDIMLIKNIYDDISDELKISFNEVYVITTKGLYSIKNNIIEIQNFPKFEFSRIVYLMKVLLKFTDELNPLSIEEDRIQLYMEIKEAYRLTTEMLAHTGKFCNYTTYVNLESLKMLTINYILALIGKRRNDKVSFYKTPIFQKTIDDFICDNTKEYQSLMDARDKVYSHFDMDYREKCGIISFAFIERCITLIENMLKVQSGVYAVKGS